MNKWTINVEIGEASCQQKREKKVTEAFLRLALPPLKVDADDDGRVGIWKAPLPGWHSGAKKLWIWLRWLLIDNVPPPLYANAVRHKLHDVLVLSRDRVKYYHTSTV